MSKQRGAVRFFRIGLEADPTDVAGTTYGTPAQGYDNPAVAGSALDMRFFQVSEGNFSLGRSPILEEQPVLRGQIGVHHRDRTGWNVSGDIAVLAHPEEVGIFLEAALERDSAQELAPHTIQEFYPGIDATEKGASYVGCKCSNFAGAWGSGSNRIIFTTTWTGQREEAYTGTLPDLADFDKPRNGYVFSVSSLIDMSAASSGITLPTCDYSEVSFAIANGLAEGPRCFDPDLDLRGAISDLIAGQERLTGSFTVQWKDLTMLNFLRNTTDVRLRNIFIHPTSDSTLTVSGVEAAGDAVEIAVSGNPTTLVAVGQVIAFQHISGGNTINWSTGKVTARTTGPNTITVATLDLALAAGDVIWTEALEIRFLTINLTSLAKQGGPDDAVITLQGQFEGKSDVSGRQILYRSPDSPLVFSP